MPKPFRTTETSFEALSTRAFAEMQKGEQCAEKATRRRARLRVAVVAEHDQRNAARGIAPPTEDFIDSILDKKCGSDPYWKSKVSGNQLHERRAAMYAGLAQVAAERERRNLTIK